MRLYLLALICLISLKSEAQTIGIDIGSIHIPHRSYLTGINPGIYVIQDGLTAGAYRNSLGRLSTFAGLTIEQGPFGLTGGLVTGYSRPILPFLAPSVKAGPVRLSIMPGLRGCSTALHLSVEAQV